MIYHLDSVINFGKHRGRTLENLICGIVMKDKDNLVENYLKCVFDFLSEEKDYDICVSTPEEIIEDVLLDIDEYRHYVYKKIEPNPIFKNIIVSNNSIKIPLIDKCDYTLYFLVIQLMIERFNSYVLYTYSNKCKPNLKRELLYVLPDRGYIIWAIKEHKDFVIDPNIIENTFICNNLKSFKIYKENGLLLYEPIIESTEFKFNEDVIEINNVKINNLNNMYEQDDSSDCYQDRSYESNNWLEDAAGSNDPEDMNDVYWNLD